MDDQTGGLVRPYLLTGGRTTSEKAEVAIDATLRTTTSGRSVRGVRSVEERLLLDLCREPRPLAQVTAELELPLGVVRVLAADLVGEGHLTTVAVREGDDLDLLERLLVGLKGQL